MSDALRQRLVRLGASEIVLGGDDNRVRRAGRVLGTRLSGDEIAAFEACHGITLPDDYRRFLVEVGSGGLGPPYYGLRPLGETVEPGAHPAAPFPLRDGWSWETDEPLAPEKDELRRAAGRDGALVLGEEGCGRCAILVVSGPARGQVWDLSDYGAFPLEPRTGFWPWFSSWLDETSRSTR